MNQIKNIDDCYNPSHDETARQGYISLMRKFIMNDISKLMNLNYEREIKPDFYRIESRFPSSGEEVRRSIEKTDIYKFWSSLRYNAQEMVWESVRRGIEREAPNLISIYKDALEDKSNLATLELDSNLEMPDYVALRDVHLMPGCWQNEYAKDDLSQGAMYAHGGSVFRGSFMPSKKRSGVACSVSKWLSLRYPDFSPVNILETGCTIGNNLFPYLEVYPNATLNGVDLAGPCLRYAFSRAVERGVKAHFYQQNAEKMSFEDKSFDLIVSSFFFHELSVDSTKKVLKECYRLLAPGGILVNMELPPSSQVDPYYNFYLDWDNEHNNEPHYREFRSQDVYELLNGSGFDLNDCFNVTIPDVGGASAKYFNDVALGKAPPPKHGNYTSWCLFGAKK